MFMSMLPGLKLRCHYSFRSKQYLVVQIGPRATRDGARCSASHVRHYFGTFHANTVPLPEPAAQSIPLAQTTYLLKELVVEIILRNLINVGFSSGRYTLPLRMPVEFLDLPGPQITDLFLGLIEGNLNR